MVVFIRDLQLRFRQRNKERVLTSEPGALHLQVHDADLSNTLFKEIKFADVGYFSSETDEDKA